MGNGEVNIRLELGVDARRMMQQVRLDNDCIEKQLEEGITAALEEIVSNKNFVQQIKDETLKQLSSIISTSVMSWELKSRIQKMVEEKIGKKVEEYADRIAEKVTEHLK